MSPAFVLPFSLLFREEQKEGGCLTKLIKCVALFLSVCKSFIHGQNRTETSQLSNTPRVGIRVEADSSGQTQALRFSQPALSGEKLGSIGGYS